MPDFYPEGNTVKPGDNELRSLHKLVALGVGGGVGDYQTGGNFFGVGSPEGVTTASRGASYWDTAANTLYYKDSGDATNTGWVQVVTGGGTFFGTGSPNGVVTGSRGNTYWDTAGDSLWMKDSGDSTNTGWVQVIA